MATIAASPISKRWIVGPRDKNAEAVLQRELNISSLLAAVLVARGFQDPEKADRFLNPSYDQLHPPELLPDYAAARDAILGAKERNELIFIHGDYDADGVTSAAILHRFLEAIGCRVETHVPHRKKEGYGIHRQAVDKAKSLGARLFLTSDCGSGASEQLLEARACGMRTVVTDHHEIPHIPEADAVVNPHRADSIYPFDSLSGAGVVFKLCLGIAREMGMRDQLYLERFVDLASLGTVADVMPLLDENRVIAKYGLSRLPTTKKNGLQALYRQTKLQERIESQQSLTSTDIGFVIGPRLNAAGRMDDADLALRLLLSRDDSEADRLATQVESFNTWRKEEQDRVVAEAIDTIVEQGLHERNFIVVASERWNAGVVGIAAGKIAEKFYRPTLVLTVDQEMGTCKGSARSIAGFNLAEAIRAFPDLLQGGGHAAAAGCSLSLGDLAAASDALHDFAGSKLEPDDFIPSIHVDVEIEASEASQAAVEELERLEPMGECNRPPVFAIKGAELIEVVPTRNPEHVRVRMRHQDTYILSIAFGFGPQFETTPIGSSGDAVLEVGMDEWQGRRKVKWMLRDYAGRDLFS